MDKHFENEPVVIDVKDVKKKFSIYLDKGKMLREKAIFRNRRQHEDRWVLKGISFQVHKGEAIGLIGQNGCGKSTTLKMLTKILYPDHGTITMYGRVSCLIELGAGFHPDMSGRENIYTNASIFGLSKEEIEKRIKDIIDFSELGEFIDTPVRTYSSGMYMRLAFAVAINVDADILLIDEILAVGDAAFQAKCFNRLREIKRKGTTIVIVSHSLGQIEQICDRTYWIDDGVIREQGKPYDVHQKYLAYMNQKNGVLSSTSELTQNEEDIESAPQEPGKDINEIDKSETKMEEHQLEKDAKRWGNRDIEILSVKVKNTSDHIVNRIECGDSMKIEIQYKANKEIELPAFGIGIFRNDGLQCYGVNTNIDNLRLEKISESIGTMICQIDRCNLLPGDYLLDVAIHKPDGFAFDYWRECLSFSVWSSLQDVGVMRLDHAWRQ